MKKIYHFLIQKKNALIINTKEKFITVKKNKNPAIKVPKNHSHEKEAYTVSYLEATIGKMKKTNNKLIDDFNELLLEAMNIYTGNIFKEGSKLSWNLWMSCPQQVSQKEWKDHANYWRESIDSDLGYPTGEETIPENKNGKKFQPDLEYGIQELATFIEKNIESEVKNVVNKVESEVKNVVNKVESEVKNVVNKVESEVKDFFKEL